MTILDDRPTRSNRDLMVFCIVSALISGSLAATAATFYHEKGADDLQQRQLERHEQRLDGLERVDAALKAEIELYHKNKK